MTTENNPLPKHIYDAFEEIDAALFTGDTFNDRKCNKLFRSYIERWKKNIPDIPIRIENWAIVIYDASGSGYTPPEFHSRKIVGNVYGHPKFENGDIITTSRIIEVINSHKIRTISGSIYELGEPDEKYLQVYPQASNGISEK